MPKLSFIDTLTARLYWPALVIMIAIMIVAPVAGFTALITPGMVKSATIAMACLDITLFLIAVFSPRTQAAVAARNEAARAAWSTQSWTQRLFYLPGDRRLRWISLVIFGEIILFQALQNHALALLLFTAFGLCVLMVMLKMRGQAA